MSVRDVIQAAAGAAGTSKTYIEDVFSTYLYTGDGSTQTINNGVALKSQTAWSTIKNEAASTTTSGAFDVDSTGNTYSGVQYTDYGAIIKNTSSLTTAWQKQVAATSLGACTAAYVDTDGSVYAAFTTFTTFYSKVIVKFNSSGVVQWRTAIQSTDTNYSVTCDSITADTTTLYATGTRYNYSTSTLNWFITINKSDGSVVTRKTIVGQGEGSPNTCKVVLDSNNDQIVLSNSDQPSAPGYYFCVSKISNGTLSWQKQKQLTISGDRMYDICCDTLNNIYVVGNSGGYGYLEKMSTTGGSVWRKQFTGGGTYTGVTTDYDDNVYVVSTGGFFCKFNSSGTLIWKATLDANLKNVKVIGSSLYINGNFGTASFVSKLNTNGTCDGTAFVTISPSIVTIGNAASLTTTDTATFSNASLYTVSAVTTSVTTATTSVSSVALKDAVSDGGMVWIKGRSGATDHAFYDTARGATYDLTSTSTAAQTTQSTGLTSFGSSGFSIGALAKLNTSAATYASWTFRKAPKFFDVVTYTGTGVARTISHSLGQKPGMIIVKSTSLSRFWAVYHQSVGATKALVLNTTDATTTSVNFWNNTEPTSSQFTVNIENSVNGSGQTYVAYLFAHDTTTDGLIQCGSFTTDASGNATVNLGWEPQYVMLKLSSTTGNWLVADNMRGMSESSLSVLNANTSAADGTRTGDVVPTATGFQLRNTYFVPNATGIYMAIRRGPMRTPTDGTKVFNNAVRQGSGAAAVVNTTITPDLVIHKVRGTTGAADWLDRLRDNYILSSSGTTAELQATGRYPNQMWDNQTGYDITGAITAVNSTSYSYIDWVFQRAPGFFDVVCYTGTGAARTINHNLGVAPELMIVKHRGDTKAWSVYHKDLTASKFIFLNGSDTAYVDSSFWNNTEPTASVFTVGSSSNTNGTDGTPKGALVAYLFASCPGVSKVGSYTGTGDGVVQQINCGFASGARFVMIKCTSNIGDWMVWDTARGIVTGNDPILSLNTTAAENTAADYLDPYSAGFAVDSGATNAAGRTYIYLAIA